MSELSKDEIKLEGGCYCSAVRYTITIPPFSERPILIKAEENNGRGEVRYPSINFDHCNDCRKGAASIVPNWFICPLTWAKWFILTSKEPFPVPSGCSEGKNVKGGDRVEISTEEFVQRPKILDGIVTAYNSSPECWRTFCTKCGSNLTYVCMEKRAGVQKFDIVFGSLDRESLEKPGVRPTSHLYCRYGISWVMELLQEGDKSLYGEKLDRHPEWDRREIL